MLSWITPNKVRAAPAATAVIKEVSQNSLNSANELFTES